MKKILQFLLAQALMLCATSTYSQQVLEYGFTGQYISEYAELQGATTLFSGNFDDLISSSITIPGVTFGGQERTSLRVNTNGWVAFGNATATSAYYPMNNTVTGADGVISPLGADLISSDGVSGSVSYLIDFGLVYIEWKNVRRFGAAAGEESFSFQLIIDTETDYIKFAYNMAMVDNTGMNPQVGMRLGSVAPAAGQYVNRSVTVDNTWLTSVGGTANNSTCRLTSTAPASIPDTGLIYWWDNSGGGCTDLNACNYDAEATVNNGSCEYCSCDPLCGCMDPNACNFDPLATSDDGSCYFELLVFPPEDVPNLCGGTLQGAAYFLPYSENATILWTTTSGSTIFNPNALEFYAEIMETSAFTLTVTDANGCTGSDEFTTTVIECVYGCTDQGACNFSESANMDDGLCDYSCIGCTNVEAVNYDPSATIDNGNCYFDGEGNVCSNPIVISCGQGVYSSMTVGVPNDNAMSDAMACGGQSSGGQRWYLYESAYNSEITVSTINALTNFDTYLKVYSGTCGDLQCIAQNDDIPGTGFQSQVMFSAVEGETYLIRVGGFASMSGTFALTFDCGGGCLDEVACNYDADAPFDDGSCTYGADCFGCNDPEAENYDPIAVFDQGCQYSPLITVFHDINGDGMQQPNEPGLPNWPVYIPAISATIFSNASGAVSITLPASNFELQLVNNGDLWISSNSSTQTISLPDNMVAQFGLIPSSGETFWAAGPYDGFWDIIHCEDGYEAGVFLNNTGAVALNGTLTMTCDASFFPEADSYLTIAPDQTAPGFAQWNIAEFGAGTDGLFSFHIPGPGLDNIGVTFPFEFTLSLVDENGEEFYTESWTTTPFVACAYDPNDLTATPEGYEAPHFILPGQRIQFRVRFQNTGNFPAEDVLIIDDLDPQVFDIASFAPIYGSADYVACLHDDGTIDFIFEDIYLPDAENNEEESHGFAVFEVFARQDIVPGTVLLNQAAIFFDSNPAIITNETFHTIFDCSSFTPMMGDTELCFGESLVLNATQPYVEYYEWMLDGEVVGNSAAYNTTLTELGSHELSLITGNPLCYETHETQVQINDIPVVNAGDDLTICPGESVVLSAISQDQTQWSDGIVNDIAFIPSASFVATVTATNEAQCATTDDVNIILFDLPSGNVTLANGILSASDGVAWQWYFEGALLEGATLQSIAVTEGAYYVVITSEDGCEVTSETTLVTNTIESAFNALTVYPNPMNDLSLISLPPGTFDLTLYDVTGRIVFNLNTRSGQVALERGSLPSGQYHLQISNLNSTHFTKILMR
jgi:uncharacterized repeat protein (TIGR01451 family)